MTRGRGWVSRIQGSVPTGHLRGPFDLAGLLPLHKRTLPTGHLNVPQASPQNGGNGQGGGNQGGTSGQAGSSSDGKGK
jgi:hypothetical protein